MEEFKGTKGEWTTDLDAYEFSKVIKAIEVCSDLANHCYGKWICQVNCVTEDDFLENKANAQLIAAAPELLDAIQCALKIVDLWLPEYNNEMLEEHKIEVLALGGMRNKMQDAINKALGL